MLDGADHVEDLQRALVEQLARIRERDATRIAQRELRAQLFFELGELVRERGLGHVEPLGGSRDLPLFRNRDKVLQLLDVHVPHLSRTCAFAPYSSCNSIQALNRTYRN